MSKQKNQEIEIEGKLNEVIIIEKRRADGSLYIAQDFQFCPTMAEQHTAHLTDVNYLIEQYKPDELAAYIAAKHNSRPEITGHDFAAEPSMQDAMNVVYRLKEDFKALPDEVTRHFKNHVEFLKFIDNPDNQEKMINLGLLTKKQIEKAKTPDPVSQTTTNQTTTTSPPDPKN